MLTPVCADRCADARFYVSVERLDSVVKLERGADCAPRVVLMSDRIAKDRDHGVA